MSPSNLRIRQVRIDVPLRTTCAYLFVDRDQERWDPWWLSLYEYLLRLVSAELPWRHEPMQDVFVAQPELTDVQRTALLAFLRTAPRRQIEEHRTLRRAVELKEGQMKRLAVMLFAEGKATPDSSS